MGKTFSVVSSMTWTVYESGKSMGRQAMTVGLPQNGASGSQLKTEQTANLIDFGSSASTPGES